MHEVRLDGRQAPAGFNAFGEWNSGDKRGTGNRHTIGRSLEGIDRNASVTLVVCPCSRFSVVKTVWASSRLVYW